MIQWNTLSFVLRGTAGLLSGLAVLAVGAYAVLLLLGYQPVAVYSGSMAPAVETGSLAIERSVPANEIRVGDVITFGNPYAADRLVTHRVVEQLRARDGRVGYRTKGDANARRDPWTIELPAQVAKVQSSVPYAGYALVYARTREVRSAVIGVMALLLLFAMLRRVWIPSENLERARA